MFSSENLGQGHEVQHSQWSHFAAKPKFIKACKYIRYIYIYIYIYIYMHIYIYVYVIKLFILLPGGFVSGLPWATKPIKLVSVAY